MSNFTANTHAEPRHRFGAKKKESVKFKQTIRCFLELKHDDLTFLNVSLGTSSSCWCCLPSRAWSWLWPTDWSHESFTEGFTLRWATKKTQLVRPRSHTYTKSQNHYTTCLNTLKCWRRTRICDEVKLPAILKCETLSPPKIANCWLRTRVAQLKQTESRGLRFTEVRRAFH